MPGHAAGVGVIDVERVGVDRAGVLLVLPGQLFPSIVYILHLVDSRRARGVAVAGDGLDTAEIVVGGADPPHGVIHVARCAEARDGIGRQAAGQVECVLANHAPLIGGAGRAAEPIIAGRNVVAVVGGDRPDLGGRVLREDVVAVGVDRSRLPRGIDGGCVEVLGGLLLDAVAAPLGIVGDRSQARRVVLVVDCEVAVGVGLGHRAIDVVLDRLDGPPSVVEVGFVVRPRLSMVR